MFKSVLCKLIKHFILFINGILFAYFYNGSFNKNKSGLFCTINDLKWVLMEN